MVAEPAAAPTRRGLLRIAGTGIGGAAAVGLAACASKKSGSHTSSEPTTTPGPDVPILSRALDLEHMAIVAYTASAPLLPQTGQLAAQRFLSQELAHAGELAGLVHQDGGKPSKPRANYDLGNPQTTGDVLALLDRIEQALIAVYLEAIPIVSRGSTRAALAAILGNEAQHSSVLRLQQGRSPVPAAFVTPSK